MKHLIYLISHGHTARGAIQTGLLNQLVKQGITVTVISKEGGNPDFLKMISEQRVKLYIYHGCESRWQSHCRNLRNYIHQCPKENPSLWEKHLRRIDPTLSSRKRILFTKISLLLGKVIRHFKPAKKIFKYLEQYTYQKQEALALLRNLNPDLIISTRPVDDMEIELLRASEILCITKVMYILSWDNITSKGFFPILADYYLTWGPVMNEELTEFYKVPKDCIYSTGITHFDVHAKIRDGLLAPTPDLLKKMGLDPSHPYLFFTMSASYYAPNEIDIIEELASKVKDGFFGKKMQLIVRPHMANLMSSRSDLNWLPRLEKIISSRVKVDFPNVDNSLLTWYMNKDDMVRLSSLINGASVCLNSGSTIAIEAVYLNIPLILTPFDTEYWPYWKSAERLMDYFHLKKFVATGACVVAQNMEQLFSAISTYIRNPNLHSEERLHAAKIECYRNDGKATERFVQNIKQILTIGNKC